MFPASVITGECEDQEIKLVPVEIRHPFLETFMVMGYSITFLKPECSETEVSDAT
jgi:hypothetical protein